MFKYTFGLWWQKDKALFIMDKDYHFAVSFMEIFVGVNVLARHTQKEPVEKIGGLIGVEGILAGDEKEAFETLLVDDSLKFFPSEEEVFEGVFLLD